MKLADKIKKNERLKFVFSVLLIVFVLNFWAFNQSVAANDFEKNEFQIFQSINTERQKQQLKNLEWDDELSKMAREHSERMADENFFAHVDPDGKSATERAQDRKLKNWKVIGENLFVSSEVKNFGSLAVKAWMDSQIHRQNILNDIWTFTGIGIAKSKTGKIYITQLFIL